MLRVFYGKGAVTVRQEAFAYIKEKEAEGYTLLRVDDTSYVQGMCADLAEGASLFGEKNVYLVDTPSSDAIFNAEVISLLKAFKDSAHAFVIVEGALLAPEKKAFAKHADALEEVSYEAKERFNAFALADSLSLKDKKTLWLQLQESREATQSAEEIIGILWWQLKALRLAASTKSASEAGMKEFPYTKAKRALRNFKEGELEALSQSLLSLYHEGHLGQKDIEYALEKWTLTI